MPSGNDVELFEDRFFDAEGNLRGNFAPPDTDVLAATREVQEEDLRRSTDAELQRTINEREREAHRKRLAALAPLIGTFLDYMADNDNVGGLNFCPLEEGRERYGYGWVLAAQGRQVNDFHTDWTYIAVMTDGDLWEVSRHYDERSREPHYVVVQRPDLERLTGEWEPMDPAQPFSTLHRANHSRIVSTVEKAVTYSIAELEQHHNLSRWPGIQPDWRRFRGVRRTTFWRRRERLVRVYDQWPWNLSTP